MHRNSGNLSFRKAGVNIYEFNKLNEIFRFESLKLRAERVAAFLLIDRPFFLLPRLSVKIISAYR